MVQDAQFIVDSLPNVKIFSVEWALRQLHVIHLVLVNFDDKWLAQEEISSNQSNPSLIFGHLDTEGDGMVSVWCLVVDPLFSYWCPALKSHEPCLGGDKLNGTYWNCPKPPQHTFALE